jgi:integrase
VPLSKRATKVFKLRWIIRFDNRLQSGVYGEPGKDGKPRPYAFTKIWGQLKKKLDPPDFRSHDLRHEAVSRLVEGGLSDQEVSAISGHKSMQMLKRYTHLRAEDLV